MMVAMPRNHHPHPSIFGKTSLLLNVIVRFMVVDHALAHNLDWL
jgi:hypothetical protein